MNFTELPKNLPRPDDNGECDHLSETEMPAIILPSTKGNMVDIGRIEANFVVLYFFPMMAVSEGSISEEWDKIPGARGCTPQNIAINEHLDELSRHGAIPIGISTQSIRDLSKISLTRHLSQHVLSDSDLKLKQELNIPVFQVENTVMYKRLTLIIKNSKIVKVFYPIFPPDKHIFEILDWLQVNA